MLTNGEASAPAVEELLKIGIRLSTERDLGRLAGLILESARSLTGADSGRVYVLDKTKRYLHLEVQQNERAGGVWDQAKAVPLFIGDKRNAANVCSYCAFAGKLVSVADAYRYSGFDFEEVYAFDKVYGYRTQSVLVVPLCNHEALTIGVLQLFNLRDAGGAVAAFDEAAESLVLAFASQAAAALNNVQLIAENRHLIQILDNSNRALEDENRRLRDRIESQYRFANIVGEAHSMAQVFELMEKVIDTNATVLLGGETGTGKELVARAIHFNGRRKNKEFVAQNCAALPEGLLESELFGYQAGAFSGAKTSKKGLIELAHGGTLFLDEIGDMPIGLQAKLLRVLQDGEVRGLGALESRKVDIRVVAATHADLPDKIAKGEFREDLYYRLNVFPIVLPPLRERREDLPSLLQYFLDELDRRYGKTIEGFAPAAMQCLLDYDYPGNIRELRNLVERAVLMAEAGGSILPEHLPPEVAGKPAKAAPPRLRLPLTSDSLRDCVGEFEATMIEDKLVELGWNQTRTAKALNISRRTLIEKMHKYNLRRAGAALAPLHDETS